MWWNRWPDANIGIPTGGASGIVVADLDGDSPEATQIWEKLPPTVEAATGRGTHRYYEVAKGTTVKGWKPATDLCVKADGGYILAPPSVHPSGARYEFVARPDNGMAAVPDELLKPDPNELTARRSEGRTRHPIRLGVGDAPIPEGSRNITLTSIAGRLHDGTRTLADLGDELMAINLARCSPPLPEDEVRRITSSIYGRTPCPPGPCTKTRKALRRVERNLQAAAWPGMGGKTDRDVVIALIKQARRHGRICEDGVEISISVRSLALDAAVSKASLTKHGGSLERLTYAGWIRRGESGSGTRAGTFVLLTRANLTHSSIEVFDRENERTLEASGLPLRAPRLRWSRTTRERVGKEWHYEVILRLGKTAGAIIDTLEAACGSATLAEIADALHVRRVRDLRRRAITRLEERGIVRVEGDSIVLVEDWVEALNREREASGEVEATRRDIARYAREREGYRNRHKTKTERAPSERQMQERRESYPLRRRRALERAIARLFAQRPEFRTRRVGQVTCKLPKYLDPDFPQGQDGYPKDAEVEAILEGVAA